MGADCFRPQLLQCRHFQVMSIPSRDGLLAIPEQAGSLLCDDSISDSPDLLIFPGHVGSFHPLLHICLSAGSQTRNSPLYAMRACEIGSWRLRRRFARYSSTHPDLLMLFEKVLKLRATLRAPLRLLSPPSTNPTPQWHKNSQQDCVSSYSSQG